MLTPPIEVEGATTPPILSSSPGMDAMDISPLPHKVPHFVAQVTLPSPTPEQTPNLDNDITPDLLAPHVQILAQASESEAPSFLQLPEYACRSW
jgi:M-phase inducer tyrosine phosphatase